MRIIFSENDYSDFLPYQLGCKIVFHVTNYNNCIIQKNSTCDQKYYHLYGIDPKGNYVIVVDTQYHRRQFIKTQIGNFKLSAN